jgi:hypothetical protein
MSSLAGVIALSSLTARTGPSGEAAAAKDEQIRKSEPVSKNKRKNEQGDERAGASSSEEHDPILTTLILSTDPFGLERNGWFIALFWRLLC